uniref:uncharacterized protein LOC122578614 n=1 Tax=Erigeron canadensis TaxID=72917 RepID=UPI001CB9840F|nr:uncharacterized protein LOC122578614 [Erigeron canadensis]
MDRNEEDMKNIGFFGIFKQSFKTIFKYTKLFTQITLTFILPLSIIFLAHTTISNRFFSRIENSYLDNYDYNRRNVTVSDWLYFWLFKVIYFTFLTVFSLLATAAVVFTIASVYADRDVVFRHVFKVVPRIWKRLVVTFVVIYLAMFLYNVIYGVIVFLTRAVFGYSTLGAVIFLILFVVYVYGFLYLSVVWQLASVVSVLENNQGIKAMRKGKELLYGKKKSGMGIAFVLYGILVGILLVYELYVQFGDHLVGLAMIWRVIIGISCCLVLMMVFLLFMVTQTVLYLVCKSYHREAIDKLSLSTFLGAYTEETVVYPKPEEIQLGRAQPQQVAQEV